MQAQLYHFLTDKIHYSNQYQAHALIHVRKEVATRRDLILSTRTGNDAAQAYSLLTRTTTIIVGSL